MKKTNTIFIIKMMIVTSLMISSVAMAQPNCQWTKGYGNADDDFGLGAAVDLTGNVYSIGQFISPTITIGSTTLINADNSGYTSDAFIMKSDSCGNVIWVKKIGNQYYDDRAKGIAIDKSGNIYVTGAYASYYIKFGTDSLSNDGTGFSTYLVKYSPAGNVLWARGLDASQDVFSTGLSIDKNGDVSMSGYYSSDSVKFDAIKITGDSYYISFLAKFNSANGNALWAKGLQYDDNKALCIATDTLNNIYIAGTFSDSIKIGTTVFKSSAYYTDAYFIKYNSAGNIVWAKSAGVNYDDGATGLATDKAGNIYLAGYFQSDSIVFGGVKLKLPNSSVYGNGFLVKYDNAGTALWAKSTGGLSEDYIEAVTTNAAGDVFIAGDFRSNTLSLDGVTLTNNLNSATTFDVFVAKYDGTGKIKWAKSAGNAGDEFPEKIAIGYDGIPFIVGEYNSASVSFGQNTITDNGMNDMFITNDINRIGVPTPQICMVTVDSLSTNNMVYWDKTPLASSGIKSFIVYREITANTYKPLALIPFDSLSLFVDTVRTKYFPNTGNPNAGIYKYKLQVVDTAGNFGLLSPWHQTIYVDRSGGLCTFNDYAIEGQTTPIPQLVQYKLMRDNTSNGNWIVLSANTSSPMNDPAYASFPNASWRIETQWTISCTPTRAGINTTRSNIKAAAAVSVEELLLNNAIQIYPNPATAEVAIQYPAGCKNYQLKIFDELGQLIYSETLPAGSSKGLLTKQIDVSNFKKGIYIMNVQTENGSAFKRLTIQ